MTPNDGCQLFDGTPGGKQTDLPWVFVDFRWLYISHINLDRCPVRNWCTTSELGYIQECLPLFMLILMGKSRRGLMYV